MTLDQKEWQRKLECSEEKARNNLLIAGIDAHICDKCIEQAHGIVWKN
jgi:ATP-dependent protease Clp ATPase subunit